MEPIVTDQRLSVELQTGFDLEFERSRETARIVKLHEYRQESRPKTAHPLPPQVACDRFGPAQIRWIRGPDAQHIELQILGESKPIDKWKRGTDDLPRLATHPA